MTRGRKKSKSRQTQLNRTKQPSLVKQGKHELETDNPEVQGNVKQRLLMKMPIRGRLGQLTRAVNRAIRRVFPWGYGVLSVCLMWLGIQVMDTAVWWGMAILFSPFLLVLLWFGVGGFLVMLFGAIREDRVFCTLMFMILPLPIALMFAMLHTVYSDAYMLAMKVFYGLYFVSVCYVVVASPPTIDAWLSRCLPRCSKWVAGLFMLALVEATSPYPKTEIREVTFSPCQSEKYHFRGEVKYRQDCEATFMHDGKRMTRVFSDTDPVITVRQGLLDHFTNGKAVH
ncbi:hypothetical protein L4C36_15390 [Photobacterium japonica]|uniref:hypothetical protein n=1 Tax=Photobacterium japonica TaxID=2910235 RepID=UPI003D0D1D86